MTSPSAAPTGPLEPGTEAPDFALRSTPDQLLSLSECRGRPVILAFYPEDWSPVCSDQLGLVKEPLCAVSVRWDDASAGRHHDDLARGV